MGGTDDVEMTTAMLPEQRRQLEEPPRKRGPMKTIALLAVVVGVLLGAWLGYVYR